MTNLSDERISALLDGELDEPDCHAAVDQLLARDETRKAWRRYQLVGDALRRNLPASMDPDFSSRVMAALDNEPTVLAPPIHKRSSWGQRAAGLAVAASVAAVAVLGVQFMYQQDGRVPTQQLAKVPAQLAPLAAQQNVARATIPPSLRPNFRSGIQTVTQSSSSLITNPGIPKQFQPRLNRYLVDHNQQASGAVMQRVIPYARIVASPRSHHIPVQAQK